MNANYSMVGHADYKTTDAYVREIGREKSVRNITDGLPKETKADVLLFPQKKVGDP